MKYKRIIFISLLLSLISLMCLNAISQELELPFLMDFAQLKLEVINTEVVDQISSSSFGRDDTTLSAKEGYKLVVVTLKGIVTHPCKIAIETREFSAIYEEETTNNKGEKETSLDVIVSDAVATGDSWSIPPVGARAFTVCPIKEPGSIILKVAFTLPEKITNFFVRYPALAKGKATIPELPTTITTLPDLPTTIPMPTIPDITIPEMPNHEMPLTPE